MAQSNLDSFTLGGFMMYCCSDSSKDEDNNTNILGDHHQEDINGWSEDKLMDVDMISEEGENGEITMSLGNYCMYGLHRQEEKTFYRICAKTYHLRAMKRVYPLGEVVTMIFTLPKLGVSFQTIYEDKKG